MEKYKAYLRNLRAHWREATASFRMHPGLIIVGAQKAGTSSLFNYMAQHPDARPSFKKEVHFFDTGNSEYANVYKKGLKWYKAHFPVRRPWDKTSVAFESSPRYLFDPDTPERIANDLPNVKIVILLRNPTERAISHYFHAKRRGNESRPIMKAMKDEEKLLAAYIERKEWNSLVYRENSYKKRGLYWKQLERYFSLFDREQILVESSERFFADPKTVLAEVFEFAGMQDKDNIDFKAKNVGVRTDVAADVYKYLNDYFREPNRKLFDMLKTTFEWQDDS